tara:strand:- start:59626 stop:59730 length:105 start_codon:yes stop_codon:yes gene_type:complete
MFKSKLCINRAITLAGAPEVPTIFSGEAAILKAL